MSMLGSKCCCKTPCDSTTASGGAGITEKIISMPLYSGFVTFTYNAFRVPDKFTVYGIYEGEEFVLFDTVVQVSGSETIQIFKPFGITQVKVRVEGPTGTAWTYYISCPERDDSGKYCGPDSLGEVRDEKTGAISTPIGGSYLSEDECAAVRTPDTVAQTEAPIDDRSDQIISPPPTTGPNGGGYFPPYVQYGFGKLPCAAQTHTNITQPRCYNLLIKGNYISNDPDVYFYYISDEYPTEAGRIIYNTISGLSQNPIETPRRQIAIWGFFDLNSNRALPLKEFTIEPNNTGTNWCSTIEKPAGIKYIVVFIAEDNPANSRALFSMNFSCLLTSDDNLFQVQDDDNVYQTRVVDLGDTAGIVDFYASIYMSDDVFVGCTDAGEPNLLPDPFKDLPRAKFRISDNDTNQLLLEFTIDARTDLDSIPLASKLDTDNTFVDRLETLFKSEQNRNIKIETWYSRNTVFRWTIGCPKKTCLSFCGIGEPNEIIVKLEAEDYLFEYTLLGADIYRDKLYSSSGSGGTNAVGPIPLAAGLTFGSPTPSREYVSFAINSPLSEYAKDRYQYLRTESYNAIYGFPSSIYNKTFSLLRQENGDYKFVFDNQEETCPDNSTNPTELVLKTGGVECGFFMNNLKAFWKWKLNKTDTYKYNCDTVWDWRNYEFSGYNCFGHSFSVGCSALSTGNIGLERNIAYGLSLFYRSNNDYPYVSYSYDKLQSAYDHPYFKNKSYWYLGNRIFNIAPCYYVPDNDCNLRTAQIPFGGISDIWWGNNTSSIRECYLDADQYSPIYRFPYLSNREPNGERIPDIDLFKSITREKGKPYIVVKSIQAVN